MTHVKLEQLFRRCDTNGTGFIDMTNFRELCSSFGIAKGDADIIFFDLDHDGDGRISFEDFSFGFRDFLTPGSRRGSLQLGLEPFKGSKENPLTSLSEEKIEEMEKKHKNAQVAWKNFTEHLGPEDVNKLLTQSGVKLFSLYEELQTGEAPSHLVSHFEDLISALMKDVKKFEEENRKMEEKYFNERQTHSKHLQNIEAELDAQVARVEQQAKEKAKIQYELEKRELQSKMEDEMTQLQAHLKLFQKVDHWLHKEKDETHTKENQLKLNIAFNENRQLKSNLIETQDKISQLRKELNDMRSQYENKCSELYEERENKMEYVYEFDNISRQLELLRGANQNLQDTNDGLQTLVDVSLLRSPRYPLSETNGFTRFNSLRSSARSISSEKNQLCKPIPKIRKTSLQYQRTQSEYSFEDSTSSTSSRDGTTDIHFNYNEDIDSGNSTLIICEEDGYPLVLNDSSTSLVSYQDENHLSPNRFNPFLRDSHSEKLSPLPLPRADKNSSVKLLSKRIVALEPTGLPDRTYKVVFAGDAAVGKTSFINRITKGAFLENLSSTLGVDYQVKTIHVDSRNITLQLWDTAGQERFRAVTRSYFRRADGVMLLYDVTSERSFASVRKWIDAVNDVSQKKIPIILCANKSDLRDESFQRGLNVVSYEQGQKVAESHSAIFLETSSKDGSNIMDSLIQLSRDMCSSEDVEVKSSTLMIQKNDRKNNCCGGKNKL